VALEIRDGKFIRPIGAILRRGQELSPAARALLVELQEPSPRQGTS
jgi:hypothetical protein